MPIGGEDGSMEPDGFIRGIPDGDQRRSKARRRILSTGIIAATFAAYLGDMAQQRLVDVQNHQFPPVPAGQRFTPSPWVPLTWAATVLLLFWLISVIVVRVRYPAQPPSVLAVEQRPIEVRPVGRWHWLWVISFLAVIVVVAAFLSSSSGH